MSSDFTEIEDQDGTVRVPNHLKTIGEVFDWATSLKNVKIFADVVDNESTYGEVIVGRMPFSGFEVWSIYVFSREANDSSWTFRGGLPRALPISQGATFNTAYFSDGQLILGDTKDNAKVIYVYEKGKFRCIKYPYIKKLLGS